MVEVGRNRTSKKSALRKVLLAQTAFSLLTTGIAAGYYEYVGPAKFFSWDKSSEYSIGSAIKDIDTHPISAAERLTNLALDAKGKKHPISEAWLSNRAISSMEKALESDISAIENNNENVKVGESEEYKRRTLELLRTIGTDLETSRDLTLKLKNKRFESMLDGWLEQKSTLESKIK